MKSTAFVKLSGVLALCATALVTTAHGTASIPTLYTSQQATTGAKAYAANCAMCHGANLEGTNGPPLVGANMKTLGEKSGLTVGDMFSYITTNMPMNAPASLGKDQYVSITAFILKQNGYPAGAQPLTYATASNSKQKMTSFK